MNTRAIESRYRTKNVEYKQHAKKHVYNFFFSIFMSYVMIQTSIFDFDLTSCLNIDENVSLCDRSFLSKNRDRYDLVHFIKFITIIDVVDMQIFDQYIEQKMLLNSNKVFIQIKTYFVNSFQFDFIIKTNVLNKENIDFLFNRRVFRVKNIEISLIYISFSINDNAINHFINEIIYMKNINEIINEIDDFMSKNEYESYFYHFVIFHTNNNDVIKSKTRKWKSIFNFLLDFQMLQNSINEITSRFFITSMINQSHANKLFIDSSAFSFINFFIFINLCFSRKCRRCKQIFISKNLFYDHFKHCDKDIQKSKHARKLDEFWKNLWFSIIVIVLITNCT